MNIEVVRQELIDWIEQESSFREMKATEFPDDQRNEQAASGLRDLAQFVRELAVDDELLTDFARAAQADGQLWTAGEPSTTLARFRFDSPIEPFEEMLSYLPDLLVDARLEGMSMLGLDSEEDSPAAETIPEAVLERITAKIPADHERSRAIAFSGRWLLNPADDIRSSETGEDAGIHFGVALTGRGRIAVHREHVNKGPISFDTYADLDEAESEGALPADIAVLARVELDPNFVQELDI